MPITREQTASLAEHIRGSDGFTHDERARLDAMTDAEIEQAARSDPDAAPASLSALKCAVAERRRRLEAAKTVA